MIESFIKEFHYFMVSTRTRLVKPFWTFFKPELSMLMMNVMFCLHHEGEMSMSELADELMLSKQQMTQLIHKLEQLGYITRAVDDGDRRRIIVRITDKAALMIDEKTQVYLREYGEMVDRLSARELKQLSAAMATVNRLLDRLGTREQAAK